MNLGQVRKIDIDQEMQQAYLDYAMSVIVARALPDARDGLKPVQRRILYAMFDLGLNPNSAFKKSARIVGEVLGKYHPHGDMAVYDAMARLAQDFTMRTLLVDGQGNFGSVDGDPPAAMRYTEARLTQAAIEMLRHIEKDTVAFSNNFDGSLKEPDVLPALLPNLLVNGATGIAVGMATNIPPHNLGEVIDACCMLLNHWDKLDDLGVEELMRHIKGPDFPTGGIIIQEAGAENLAGVYGTGKGRVIIQARTHVEEMDRGKNRIIVTELPYMVNKSTLIERIAELVRDGNLEGVVDLRDESDRHGLRVVIEVSKTIEPEKVLQKLYKHTPMQSTFGINLLALVGGEPRLLTLKQALKVYLDHRLVVIQRRSEYDLEKARQRAHILEGLRVALKHLDEIIALIRNSSDTEQARDRLMKRYRLSDIQAQAILDMPLKRLAALERKKIEDEYRELIGVIKELEGLLRSPKKIREVAVTELQSIREQFADKRKTQIISMKAGDTLAKLLTITDVTPSQKVWVGINESGLIARSNVDKPFRSSGKDAPAWMLLTDTHHTLYLCNTNGKAAAVPVHAVPEAAEINQGVPIVKISPIDRDDPLGAVFSLPGRNQLDDTHFAVCITHGGMVKKTSVLELPGPSAQGFTICKVNEGDTLGWILITNGGNEIVLATSRGMCIRFSEVEARPMGLVAAGVAGIKLKVGDEVCSAALIRSKSELILLGVDGKGKRNLLEDYPTQSRYGQGVIAWRSPTNARVAGMAVVRKSDHVLVLLEKSAGKYLSTTDFPQGSRAAAAKKILDLRPGDAVIGIVTAEDMLREWGENSEDGTPSAPMEKKKRTSHGDTPPGLMPPKPATQQVLPGLTQKTPRVPAGRKPKTEGIAKRQSSRKNSAAPQSMDIATEPGKGKKSIKRNTRSSPKK